MTRQAMAVLQDAVAPMLGWLQRFRRPAPDDAAAIEVPQTHGCGAGRAAIALSGVADIEESVWVRITDFSRRAFDGNPLSIPLNHRIQGSISGLVEGVCQEVGRN